MTDELLVMDKPPEGDDDVQQLREQLKQVAAAVDNLTTIVNHRAEERAAEQAGREAAERALNEKIVAIGNFVDGVVEHRDKEVAQLFAAVEDRPARAELTRMWREYDKFAGEKQARMLDAVMSKYVAPLRDDVKGMGGTIKTWSTYRSAELTRLSSEINDHRKHVDARFERYQADVTALNRGYSELYAFVHELAHDVRGNPADTNAPSLSSDIRELKLLITRQQDDFNAKWEKTQQDHRQEMAALRAKVDAQAGVIDLLLAVPRAIGNVVSSWTGFKSLPNGKNEK